MPNPYTLTFGKEPLQMISRTVQENEIIENFTSENPSQQVYMITGIRGSGKTVFMSEIQRRLVKKPDWIIVELNPQRDMLNELAAKLCSEDRLAQIFKNAKINLSFLGFGLEVSGTAPISDIEVALERMLKSLSDMNKKILIAIDEAVGSENMRVFASSFQIMIRKNLPVYLLMTGLYENINELQNEKSLTFLYRAPKMELKSLNIGVIADNYKKILNLDYEKALGMARLTRGYAFAFQVLGYFTWEHGGNVEDGLPDFKQYLDDYVYDKIWSELSNKDRTVLNAMAETNSGGVAEIREKLGLSSNEFSPYRKRLVRKGIINGDERGYVRFALPQFENYVREHYYV